MYVSQHHSYATQQNNSRASFPEASLSSFSITKLRKKSEFRARSLPVSSLATDGACNEANVCQAVSDAYQSISIESLEDDSSPRTGTSTASQPRAQQHVNILQSFVQAIYMFQPSGEVSY
ncbi:hypothetical protein KP509_29G016200 [Ceratopteris richardii]|uniref:Uncharacterized protein n=1 Tax=Ceratopteris richardii TaxID=49495 RepID=A0A8T2R5Z9_CERRI|nr:hypothetical protein KP509_29G016200 [Ceratopteris richardii]